jgi:hypothetical protein
MTQASLAVKAAELTSSLRAIILGAGIALFGPDFLREHAGSLLLVGMLVHASGMTLKYRLEARERPPVVWERALFLLCWVMLLALAAWLALKVAGR